MSKLFNVRILFMVILAAVVWFDAALEIKGSEYKPEEKTITLENVVASIGNIKKTNFITNSNDEIVVKTNFTHKRF